MPKNKNKLIPLSLKLKKKDSLLITYSTKNYCDSEIYYGDNKFVNHRNTKQNYEKLDKYNKLKSIKSSMDKKLFKTPKLNINMDIFSGIEDSFNIFSDKNSEVRKESGKKN